MVEAARACTPAINPAEQTFAASCAHASGENFYFKVGTQNALFTSTAQQLLPVLECAPRKCQRAEERVNARAIPNAIPARLEQ